ncbi:unnamed protein product [Rotaria socialis]|uniref:Uncharacterized protein n=1 Tax=Rotaria socialis TaxID=392032 RepID=A0A817XJV6_9BILA|nr:unnamed protein product [Rotaria socialis]
MSYIEKSVHLSQNQAKKLNTAVSKKSPVSFRIDPKKKGNINLLLTQTQINKISKLIPFDLKLSIAQVRALSSKQGGFIFSLPALLAAGTAIGSLASGAAAVAKTINEKKAKDKQLKEMERHNKELEGELNIQNFRGVFMRDVLPQYSKNIECGILNLDSINGSGTHWTCWIKQSENLCYYFDSFGVNPPIEFKNYVKCDILYSTYQIQKMEE